MGIRSSFIKLKHFVQEHLYLKSHPIFGRMKVDIEDDGEIIRYHSKTTVTLSGKKVKVDVNISPDIEYGLIEKERCDTYKALLSNWEKIIPDVLQAILEYQNKEWDFSDPGYTIRHFPRFKTVDDVLRNIELACIDIEESPLRYMKGGESGRYAVLVFFAEWAG